MNSPAEMKTEVGLIKRVAKKGTWYVTDACSCGYNDSRTVKDGVEVERIVQYGTGVECKTPQHAFRKGKS